MNRAIIGYNAISHPISREYQINPRNGLVCLIHVLMILIHWAVCAVRLVVDLVPFGIALVNR